MMRGIGILVFIPDAPCTESPDIHHCFHHTGVTTHHHSAGADHGLCCFCGVHMIRRWSVARERIEGHGKHAWHDVRKDEAPELAPIMTPAMQAETNYPRRR